MKHLIVYAHPNKNSLNSRIKQGVTRILQQQYQEVQCRDLYEINFDPVLSLADMNGQRQGQVSDDVRQEQEYISWADCITFIYPIWWTGLPAMMKGYIDRVMSYGFAYRYDQGVQKGLLAGKQAVIINTQGKSKSEYRNSGMDKALSLTSDLGIFTYCGLEVKQHYFFDQADRAKEEDILNWEEQIENAYKSGDPLQSSSHHILQVNKINSGDIQMHRTNRTVL